MRWCELGFIGLVGIAVVQVHADRAQAQTAPTRKFEPGQLVVGYKSEQDRATAASKLREKSVRVRGVNAAPGMRIEQVGTTELLIHIDFPTSVTRGVRSDPASDLALLEETAKNLKESDSSVEYAHPNWVQSIDPPAETPREGAIKLQSLTIEPQAVPQQGGAPGPSTGPNDPLFVRGFHWHYQSTPMGMNAVGAWKEMKLGGAQQDTGQPPVIVAVLDTGILLDHEDIKDSRNLLEGYDFVTKEGRRAGAADRDDCQNPSWHGTHVAGTVGAVGSNNGKGMAGVAWNVKVLPIRVLGRCGGGNVKDSSDAIRWAAGYDVEGVPKNQNKADIISMSLGGDYACSASEVKAVADARKAGTVVVVSAGNGAFRDADRKQCDCERGENGACKNVQCKKIPIDIKQYSPAGCPGVISVGAADKFGHITYYSNYGGLTVMAPGGDTRFLNDERGNRVTDPQTYCPGHTCYTSEGVLSAIKGGYGWYQGTSQAAPHVSGALALALVAHPEWRGKPDLIEQKLRASVARAPQGACPADKPCGPGLLDAGKLVAQQGMVRSMIEKVRNRGKGVSETLPASR